MSIINPSSPLKKQPSITQDNQLIEASYRMTLNEKRVLMLGMCKVNPMDFPDESTPLRFNINAKEWSNNYQDENPYREMKRAVNSIMGKRVTLHPKAGIAQKIAWFDYVKYHDDKSNITICFGRSIQARLASIFEPLMQVNLLSINKLRGLYSVRLYELLSQYRNTGVHVIPIEDFRVAMDCVNRYNRPAELKRNVLNPAIKELNIRSDLQFECTDIKQGKKIKQFKFVFFEEK